MISNAASPRCTMSTTKPHSLKPLWIKVAIFRSSSTTKILMKPNSDFRIESFSVAISALSKAVWCNLSHIGILLFSQTVLSKISLGVSHKDIFHIRFHPAVTQPTKVLIGPQLQPTVEQRLRVARLNSQPTTT